LSEIREAEYLSDGCKIPQNLRYVGLERREYDDLLGSVAGGEAFCYAVLHFLIDDATDIEVAEVAEWLKRPKWYGEKYLTSLLDNAGIGKCKYSKGGFSCEKKIGMNLNKINGIIVTAEAIHPSITIVFLF